MLIKPHKHTPVTAIEFDETVLKIISANPSPQGPGISAIVISKIHAQEDDSIASEISQAVRSLARPVKKVILSIPRHLAIVRYLSLPSTDDNEVRDLASYQIFKQVPHSPDEIVYDYEILHKSEDGFSTIMAVIVLKKIVQRYIDILSKAALEPVAVRFNSQSYVNAFLQIMRLDRPTESHGNQNVLFISPDYTRMHIAIIKGGILYFCRSIPAGIGENTADKGNWSDQVAREIGLTITAFRKEGNEQEIGAAYIDKTTPLIMEALPAISQKLGIALTPLDSDSLVTRTGTKLNIDDRLKEISLSGITGLVLDEKRLSLNLLPPELKHQRDVQAKKNSMIKSAVFGVLTVLLSVLFIATLVFNKLQYIDKLDAHTVSVKVQAESMESKKNVLMLTKERIDAQGRLLDILNELFRIIPPNISISSIAYEKDTIMTIKGTCPDLSHVFELIPELEKSPFFENVASKYASTRRTRESEITDFQIDCNLKK